MRLGLSSSGLSLGALSLGAIAFLLPWLTHFADGGLSFLAHFGWLALAIAALVHGGRGWLWLLLSTALALFWPATLIGVVLFGDLRLSF